MPSWFMPKDQSAYDAWTWKTKELDREKFLLLKDKSDGRLFICDEQL
jgi:hypothetical protein